MQNDAERLQSATSLTLYFGSISTANRPSELWQWRNDYRTAYTNAYQQAKNQLGGTNAAIWSNLDWRYYSPSLFWRSYEEDPANTYSASTSTPRDGTGCDLIDAAADGTATVEATRLDYETSSYGKANIYSTRTASVRVL